MKSLLLMFLIIITLFSCKQKEISWVAIGDSITYLNDHPDETGNRVSKGYMSLVVEKIPEITYTNKGYNGWTSGDIADSIESLDIKKADIYSIFLGTNDWWSGRNIGALSDYQNNSGNTTVYGSFRIIIDKLQSLNNDARIILITPMPRVDFVCLGDMQNNAWGSYKERDGQSLAQVAEALKTIAEYEKIVVIDLYNKSEMSLDKLVKYKRLKDPQTGEYKNYMYPEYTGIPFNPETDEYPYPVEAIGITYDGLHPSDAGNKIIANMLIEILKN